MANDTMYMGGSSSFNETTGSYVSATPNVPSTTPAVSNQDIKVATPDLIQFNSDEVPIEYMTDLLFEQVGGQEILSISRHDIINGQKVLYTPIKNAARLGAVFNPLNMFPNIQDMNSFFKNFAIHLEDKVPEIGTDFSNDQVLNVVYVDDTNGNLIVNVVNMLPDERVEVQVVQSGDILDDIIY